ncbi:glycosyltransferase 8 domain-containing protein 1-like [Limulus polyphemus]|uniref:Glycosyltransferase 8 domain-containing protein 1-like n=1 Tax=Limulus polyphemus TaxID=6850 RepID=A0ABM1SLC8_LIMPO|nr:glycosyltransferase 8 domain-containing protein 1-like [Limulus polyphemus]
MKRSQNLYLIKVIVFLVAVCCIVGTYYAFNPNFLPPLIGTPLSGRSERHVFTTKDIIQVMVVSEEARLGGAIATINSVISNTKSPVHFYLVTDNSSIDHLSVWIEKSDLKKISYEIKLFPKEWLKGKIALKDETKHASYLNYAKLFIPKLFPQIKGRLVYLDDDSIVQGDIAELANSSIAAGHVGAFTLDCDSVSKHFNSIGNKYGNFLDLKNKALKDIKINPADCVFSLGVFVLNLTEWESQGIGVKLDKLMELNVNLVSGLTTGSRYSKHFLQKAKLLHWDGHFKPWVRRAPYSDMWKKYYITDPFHKFHIPSQRES